MSSGAYRCDRVSVPAAHGRLAARLLMKGRGQGRGRRDTLSASRVQPVGVAVADPASSYLLPSLTKSAAARYAVLLFISVRRTPAVSGPPLWAGPLDWEVRRLHRCPRCTVTRHVRHSEGAPQENQSPPSDHSITSSARCRSDGGIFRPSVLAVFKLITNSNFVGCSTGRSAGFAPFKILSTYGAARLNKS